MHPLIRDLKILSDNEVEQKILDLNKKYWQTQNLQAQHQISIALDTYKLEQESRRARQKIEQMQMTI